MQWPRRVAVLLASLALFTTTASAQQAAPNTTAAIKDDTTSAVIAATSCPSVPRGTLTSSCDGACSSYQACVAPATTSSSSGCRCITMSTTAALGYKGYALLIPYDSATNASLNSAKLPAYETITGKWGLNYHAYVSNSEVSKITSLNIPPTATSVSLRGGVSIDALAKGYVAKVEIDGKFLAAQPQVAWLTLANLDLTTSINGIVANFPRDLATLDLSNTALTTFPAAIAQSKTIRSLALAYNNIERITTEHSMPDLTGISVNVNKLKSYTAVYPKLEYLNLGGNKLPSVPEVVAQHKSLATLHLGDNSISKFDQSHAIASLTFLTLYNNVLTTFDAYLPNIEKLGLSANSLTKFPPVIFSFGKLKELYITNNDQMQNVSFTNKEANFLSYLTVFWITNTSLWTDCASDQKHVVANVTVCINDGKNPAMLQLPRIVAPAPSSNLTPSTNAPDPKKSSSLGMAIGIGGVVLVLVLLAVVLVVRRRRRAARKPSVDDDETAHDSTLNDGSNSRQERNVSLWNNPDLMSLKVSVDDVQDIKKLGSGAFADVWLVKFRNAELMASKRLRESTATRSQVQDFIDEIKLVSTLKHPSVVELKGVAWVREADLQALFEYMDSGDLRDYLTNPQVPVQWSAEKLQIAVDVAEALVYVHSFMPPLVHRDLKSRNVLLTSDSSGSNGVNRASSDGVLHAKLTDFGVSRYQSEQNTMTAGVGTGRWLAPEVILGSGDYGSAADIFSFGVVLYELDTHQIPYADARTATGNKIADVALLQLVASGELTPRMSASCPSKIAELATRCFALSPAVRPTAPEVAYALRTIKKNLASLYM